MERTVKTNISLRQLIDVDEANGSRDRYDNIFHGQVMTAYVVKDRPKVFRFQYLSSVVQAGTGIGVTQNDNGSVTIENLGVTKIIAGTNVTVSPPDGVGEVTINASGTGGASTWGSITGILSAQLDLQAALNGKYDTPTGTTLQYIRGDGSLATFPTIPGGTVTSVTATSPMTSTGGTTPNLAMSSANSTTSGYLLSSDWLTFNGKFNTPTGTTLQYVRGDGSLATFPTIPTVTPAALTKTDDTNITLTLGGTPSTALLQAVSLTLGWTGTLADSRIASASTWNAKQAALVSGTNIKTINGNSLLGSGDLSVSGSSGKYVLTSNVNGTSIVAGTTYIGIGAGSGSTPASNRYTMVMAGTCLGAYMRISGAQTGTGVFTVLKNGSATSMTFTIPNGSASGVYKDTVNTFSTADYDELCMQLVQSTSTSTRYMSFGFIMQST